MASNISTFDYSSRDFQTIKQDLLRRAEVVTPDWTDRDPSDFGVLLIDLWAYMGDVIHYYVDRAAQEAFVETATQRESVLAYANLFDYIPNFLKSATATVVVANSSEEDIVIPEGSELVAINDNTYYYFYTSIDHTVPALGTATISVTEGDQVTEEVLTTSSSGTANQRYTLRNTYVAPSSVRVFVYESPLTPDEWQRVETFNTVDTEVGAFAIYVNANEETEVVFGNRINGRIPPTGVKITASYTNSSGANGNIPANSFVSFKSTVSPYLTIQSSSTATGGMNNESVASIRRSIRSVSRAQDRAVTLTDYSDLALRVMDVAKAVAEYDAETATVTVYPVPYVSDYTAYTGYSIAIPSAMQTAVVDYLSPRAMAGVTVESATSIEVNRVDLDITLKVEDKRVAPWVEADVVSAISSLFTFSRADLGMEVRIADVYKAVLGVSGVEYAIVNSLEIKNSVDDTITTLPANVLLRQGTVTLTVSGGVSTL